MVQMKDELIISKCIRVRLYIPHGSDESKCDSDSPSHLSQLYIPHGSDESISLSVELSQFADFISHMVQMKVGDLLRKIWDAFFFISHMVQMKGRIWKKNKIVLRNFISHMVQMKGMNSAICFFTAFFLYIPHGSDEREGYRGQSRIYDTTLYPTWFR